MTVRFVLSAEEATVIKENIILLLVVCLTILTIQAVPLAFELYFAFSSKETNATGM